MPKLEVILLDELYCPIRKGCCPRRVTLPKVSNEPIGACGKADSIFGYKQIDTFNPNGECPDARTAIEKKKSTNYNRATHVQILATGLDSLALKISGVLEWSIKNGELIQSTASYSRTASKKDSTGLPRINRVESLTYCPRCHTPLAGKTCLNCSN